MPPALLWRVEASHCRRRRLCRRIFVGRDANAALNLETWPSSSFSVSGRGGCVSQAMPAVASEASIRLPAAAGLD